MTATGALLGLLLGLGLVLVAAGVPWWRRARLESRLAPYLDRGAAKAARAAAAAVPVTPFPTLERLLRPTFVELAATLGFLGLFTVVFGWSLARHDAVPLKDPALAECLDYHS